MERRLPASKSEKGLGNGAEASSLQKREKLGNGAEASSLQKQGKEGRLEGWKEGWMG